MMICLCTLTTTTAIVLAIVLFLLILLVEGLGLLFPLPIVSLLNIINEFYVHYLKYYSMHTYTTRDLES